MCVRPIKTWILVADRADLDLVRQTAAGEWASTSGRRRRGLLLDLSFSDSVKIWLRRAGTTMGSNTPKAYKSAFNASVLEKCSPKILDLLFNDYLLFFFRSEGNLF
jgi:hypothetical protein